MVFLSHWSACALLTTTPIASPTPHSAATTAGKLLRKRDMKILPFLKWPLFIREVVAVHSGRCPKWFRSSDLRAPRLPSKRPPEGCETGDAEHQYNRANKTARLTCWCGPTGLAKTQTVNAPSLILGSQITAVFSALRRVEQRGDVTPS